MPARPTEVQHGHRRSGERTQHVWVPWPRSRACPLHTRLLLGECPQQPPGQGGPQPVRGAICASAPPVPYLPSAPPGRTRAASRPVRPYPGRARDMHRALASLPAQRDPRPSMLSAVQHPFPTPPQTPRRDNHRGARRCWPSVPPSPAYVPMAPSSTRARGNHPSLTVPADELRLHHRAITCGTIPRDPRDPPLRRVSHHSRVRRRTRTSPATSAPATLEYGHRRWRRRRVRPLRGTRRTRQVPAPASAAVPKAAAPRRSGRRGEGVAGSSPWPLSDG